MKRTKIFAVAALLAMAVASPRAVMALGQAQYVEFSKGAGSFAVVEGANAATIYVDSKDWPGVARAAGDLSNDIKAITGKTPKVVNDAGQVGRMPIIIGTLGKSPLIDQLVAAGKIDVSKIKGKWESSFTQVVANPLPGVESALVIVGSDKRG